MDRDELRRLVETEAVRRGIDPRLAWAITMQESGGNPNVSARPEPRLGTASYGPMQILGTTARGMGFEGSMEELASPTTNVPLGMEYLSSRRMEGIKRGLSGKELTDWMVAAYNAGTPRKADTGQFMNQGYLDSVMGLFGAQGGGASPETAGMPASLQMLMGQMGQLGGGVDLAPLEQYIQKEREALGESEGALLQEEKGLGNVDQQLAASLQNNPLAGPRLPVPEERTPGNRFTMSLAANIASALTGNPMFAGQNLQQLEQEGMERRNTTQQNVLLERSEMLARRSELLEAQRERYSRARAYYESKQAHVRAAEFKKLELKMMTEKDNVDELRGALKDWGSKYLEGENALTRELAQLGLVKDESGNIRPIQGAKIKGLASTSDKLPKAEDMEKMLNDLVVAWSNMNKKTIAPEAQHRLAMRYWQVVAHPRQGDTMKSIWQRLETSPGLPGQLGLGSSEEDIAANEQMMAAKLALLHGTALAYQGVLPGADEAVKAMGSVPGAQAAVEEEPKETKKVAALDKGEQQLKEAEAWLAQLEQMDASPDSEVPPERMEEARKNVERLRKRQEGLKRPTGTAPARPPY